MKISTFQLNFVCDAYETNLCLLSPWNYFSKGLFTIFNIRKYLTAKINIE